MPRLSANATDLGTVFSSRTAKTDWSCEFALSVRTWIILSLIPTAIRRLPSEGVERHDKHVISKPDPSLLVEISWNVFCWCQRTVKREARALTSATLRRKNMM
jgi:hypothetical protein